MKNNIKTFFIEAKKILFIPLIFCVSSILVELLEIVFLKNNDHAENLMNMDKLSMIFLYAFFCILSVCLCYRIFSARKIYNKVRVSEVKLFLIRAIIVFLASSLYVFVLLGIGTIKTNMVRKTNFLGYASENYSFAFTFLDKKWWYCLFPVSVGTSSLIILSLFEVVKNAIFSKGNILLRVCSVIAFFVWFFFALNLIFYSVHLPTVGARELFANVLPIDGISSQAYLSIIKENPNSNMISIPTPSFIICNVAWNIGNLATLICGILIVLYGFSSSCILNYNINDCYLYKKEEKYEIEK